MTGSYGFRDRPSRQDLFLPQNESADPSPVLLTQKIESWVVRYRRGRQSLDPISTINQNPPNPSLQI